MKTLLLGAVAATLFYASGAQAASDLATRFGAREMIQQISISPDGKQLAMIQPTPGRGNALVIANLADGSTKPILSSSGDPDRLLGCQWATDTRLVCQVSMLVKQADGRIMFSRLEVIDADGKNVRELSSEQSGVLLGYAQDGGEVIDWGAGNADGTLLMTHAYVPEQSTGTHLANTAEGLGVDRVDVATLRHRALLGPHREAVSYVTDGYGEIRLMELATASDSGDATGRVDFFYRKPKEDKWLSLSTAKEDSQTLHGFEPLGIDRDKNLVYGIESSNGHKAIYSIALDGSLERKLVYARPDADVDDIIRIGRQRRPVGVSYATDRRLTVFFDPALQALAQSFSKALPGLPLVSFVDASADESRLVLFAGSDTDPGHYYLFDKATHHLEEIESERPQLAGLKLAEQRSITYKAADGTMIPAYLTLPAGSSGKNLPAIVMPHGGPSDRDEWGFDWLVQFFASRGYAVLQPNYRGSSGYGDAWFQKNGFQSWRTAIGDVNDGGRWLISQGIAVPSKLAIVGWSYGGYAALQSAVLDPSLFKAIVAVAPVTDFDALKEEHRNFTDFQLVSNFVGSGEHIRSGSPAQNASRITAPVLLFHGDVDQNVGIGESRLMASRLKSAGRSVELVEFKGLDHQLRDNQVRADMLDKMDGFLKASLGQ